MKSSMQKKKESLFLQKSESVTKAEFDAYVRVQMSGRYNMFTEADYAKDEAGLDWETYKDILCNYSKYTKQFGSDESCIKEALDQDAVLSKVKDVFTKNNLDYSYHWNPRKHTIEVDVEYGDWKHDHVYLDNVMEESGFNLVDTRQYGEELGGDWYSAVHVYKPLEQFDANSIVGLGYKEASDILVECGYGAEWIPERFRNLKHPGSPYNAPEFNFSVFRGRSDVLTVTIDRTSEKVKSVITGIL